MNPPPLPPTPMDTITGLPGPARGATSLGSVILGVVSLELSALLRPSAWIKFGLFAVGLIVVTKLSVPRGDADLFSKWMVDVVALKIVPLLCLVVGGGVLRNQIRNFTIEYLWTRPVRKAHLVIAAWCSTVLIVWGQAVVGTLLVYATGRFLGVPNLWSNLPLLLVVEFLVVLAFAAIALAFGASSGKYMVLGLGYGFVVEAAVSRIPTNLNLLAVTHHAEQLLRFSPGSLSQPGFSILAQSLGGIFAIGALALGIAATVFTYKHYSVGSEKES